MDQYGFSMRIHRGSTTMLSGISMGFLRPWDLMGIVGTPQG